MSTASQFAHTSPPLSQEELRLLARTAHALIVIPDGDKREALRFLERAASAGDRDSQMSLGLLLARMNIDGTRSDAVSGVANYKEAIRWLTLAADQGVEKAWYAISRIYQKAEFSQRNLSQAHAYLCKAASAGYDVAQRELGLLVWRTRKGDASRDVLAVYWLHNAALQGCNEAATQLEKLASRPSRSRWAIEAQRQLAQHAFKVPLVLNMRIALAVHFGLSLPEALLIDLPSADHGHCLLVDIRADYARGRRRLILIGSDDDRAEIDRIRYTLEGLDCSLSAEGRYRQRLYRLKKLVPDWSAVRPLLRG